VAGAKYAELTPEKLPVMVAEAVAEVKANAAVLAALRAVPVLTISVPTEPAVAMELPITSQRVAFEGAGTLMVNAAGAGVTINCRELVAKSVRTGATSLLLAVGKPED
jgi:hypothetical protein